MIEFSIVGYKKRGKWGNNKFRGNCSGYLIVDLIEHFKPKSVLDPMKGSNTTQQVCRELGVKCDSFDLRNGFDILTSKLPPKKYDLIFLHPPYWNIIKYSRKKKDLSNSKTFSDYIKKLSIAIQRVSEYLSEKGIIVILVGNVRKKGRYYPIGAFIEVLFFKELKEEVIKIQYNATTLSYVGKKPPKLFFYRGRDFIPIAHEKVLVLKGFKPITWGELVVRVMKTLDKANLGEIYNSIECHPKTITNPTWKSTVRRELQQNAVPIDRGIWKCI